MKVVSFNANGIRASVNKGFCHWVKKTKPDVICIQELKAKEHQIPEELRSLKYHEYLKCAERPGYSGVAIYSKVVPKQVDYEIGHEDFDIEGRFIQAHFHDVSIASIYFPSGSSKEERQQFKYKFLDFFYDFVVTQKRKRRQFIYCGDYNIAHKKIDIKNWRSNQKNSGFLPEERAWMDKLVEQAKFIDSFRVLNDEADQYTWWSNRGKAYEKNVGWRLDYQFITPGLKDHVKKVSIYRGEKFSDHAPFVVEYNWSL